MSSKPYLSKKSNAGSAAPTLGLARRLAAEIEERRPAAVTAERLDLIARGIDPDAEVDPQTGKRKGFVPPPWEIRWKAELALLERSAGKPKSHVVLEGNVGVGVDVSGRIDQRVAVFALDARDLDKALPGDKLDAFREAQRALVEAARKKVEAIAAASAEADE